MERIKEINIADRSIDVLKRTTVYRGFFSVDEVELRYERANGEMSDVVVRVSVEWGDAVGVLLWARQQEKLVLVRQFRYPMLRHNEPWLLEIVAGSIDPGENAPQAASRELMEETGAACPDPKAIGEFFGSPGGMSEMVSLFFAEVEDFTPGDVTGLPGEDLEMVALSPQELFHQLREGMIRDGKTQVALYWFFTNPVGQRFIEA